MSTFQNDQSMLGDFQAAYVALSIQKLSKCILILSLLILVLLNPISTSVCTTNPCIIIPECHRIWYDFECFTLFDSWNNQKNVNNQFTFLNFPNKHADASSLWPKNGIQKAIDTKEITTVIYTKNKRSTNIISTT